MKERNSRLVQGEAIVDATIHPGRVGRVYFRGSWWSARCNQPLTLEPGEVVYVVGSANITLLVIPASQVRSNALTRAI